MNNKITETSKNILQVDSNGWLAEIAVNAGANMFRLRHKPDKLEILRSPSDLNELHSQPQMYGVPVLFPPNRIDGGKFIIGKQQYSLPVNEPELNNHLHGLILGQAWELAENNDNTVKMLYNFDATSAYPHDFTLEMSYIFSPEAVIQKFSIHNHSTLPMPFGLGFHTAFKVPNNAQIKITVGEGYWETDQRHLPTGKLIPWETENHIFTNQHAVSCHCPVATKIIDGKPFRGAIIKYPDSNNQVYYEVDEKYRHWCIWNNGGGKGFFCPEPMTWMVNAPNLDLPPEISGTETINPDSSWSAQTRIYVKNN